MPLHSLSFQRCVRQSGITVNPKQCSGRPCIRGMRIRVSDILDLFVAGLSAEQILAEMPDLLPSRSKSIEKDIITKKCRKK